MRLPTSSLPGLTPQVGLARLAALNNAELGQARVPVQSILLRKKMDARVTSAFTRVFDALLPAHDGSTTSAPNLGRRAFIAALAASATAWPRAARAQQGERMRRIGVLTGVAEGDLEIQARNAALLQGLAQLGWTDGHNMQIDIRWG